MDKKTEETMMANLLKNTGKSIDEWIEIAKLHHKGKHGETVKLMKEKYDLGLFFADLILHKANGTDSGSASIKELIEKQYKGKEQLKPIYDKILQQVLTLGSDIEVAPKNAYVSLRRKKQFACLKPATKSRFEVELILKGQAPEGILEAIQGAGAMCTHKIKIENESQITPEVYRWITLAYQNAN